MEISEKYARGIAEEGRGEKCRYGQLETPQYAFRTAKETSLERLMTINSSLHSVSPHVCTPFHSA